MILLQACAKLDLEVQKIKAAGEPKVEVITATYNSNATNSVTDSLKKSHSICDLKSNVCSWWKKYVNSSYNYTCNASFDKDVHETSGDSYFKVKVGDLYLTMHT